MWFYLFIGNMVFKCIKLMHVIFSTKTRESIKNENNFLHTNIIFLESIKWKYLFNLGI
jgi:hypothetical protein